MAAAKVKNERERLPLTKLPYPGRPRPNAYGLTRPKRDFATAVRLEYDVLATAALIGQLAKDDADTSRLTEHLTHLVRQSRRLYEAAPWWLDRHRF